MTIGRRGARWLCAALGLTGLVLGAWPGAGRTARAQAPTSLPVPYISQIADKPECEPSRSTFNNCGPASLAMLIDANGRRPAGLDDAAFVDAVREGMTGEPFHCRQGMTSFADIATGATAFGLCPRDPLYSMRQIEAALARCLPVVTLVHGDEAWRWMSKGSHLLNSRHFITLVGAHAGMIYFHNPMRRMGPDRMGPPEEVARADLERAIRASGSVRWGAVFGDGLGGCDLARCNGAATGAGSAPPPVFDRVTVRMTTTCPQKVVQLYYSANGVHSYGEDRSVKAYLQGDVWQRVDFDMAGRRHYRNRLTRLRLDVSARYGCFVGLGYVLVGNASSQVGRYYPFYQHARRSDRPLGSLLGWMVADGLRDLGPRETWDFTATREAPWIFHPAVDLDTGLR